MFCSKCGTKLADGVRFCPNCGQAAGTYPTSGSDAVPPASDPAIQTQASGTEPVPGAPSAPSGTVTAPGASMGGPTAQAPYAPTAQTTPFAAPDFQTKKTAKPKKGGKKKIAAIIAAVVAVALVLAIVLNLSTLRGTLIKLFRSDAAYFQYVEERELGQYTEAISSLYDRLILDSTKMDLSAQANLSLNIGNDAFDLVRSMGYYDDLSWLNELELGIDANILQNMLSTGVDVNISGQDILSLSEVFDLATGELFLSLPDLSDKVLKLEAFNPGMPNNVLSQLELISKLGEILPSEAVFHRLLTNYISTALDCVTNVSSSKVTLNIDGVSQKCTALQAGISERTACDMARAVLRELKADREIKSLLTSFQDEILESLPGYYGNDDLYEEFIKEIDYALERFDEMRKDASIDVVLTVTSYVNGRHEVIGHSVTVGGETILEYATAQKGGRYATILRVGGYNPLVIEGSGTVHGDKKTGTYTVSNDYMEYLTLQIENFDTQTLKEGYLNGTFRVTPSEQFLSRFYYDSSVRMVLSVLDPVLEVKTEMSRNANSLTVNLLNKTELFGGFTLRSDISDGRPITKPTANLVSVYDEEDMLDFVLSLRLDELLTRLERVNLPSELIDTLRMGIAYLEWLRYW